MLQKALLLVSVLTMTSAFSGPERSQMRVRYKKMNTVPVGIVDRDNNTLYSTNGTEVSTLVPATETIARTQASETVTSDDSAIKIHFRTNSSELSTKSLNQISQALSTLKAQGVQKIEITGFADIRGTEKYNQRLSTLRALSVQELLNKHGLNQKVLKAQGAGELEAAKLSEARVVEIKVVR